MKTICIAIFATAIMACSTSNATDAAVIDPVCSAIMDHCHPYATGPGIPMDCHTLAEANDGTVCRARQAECFAACVPPTDSSTPTDASDDAMMDVMDMDATDASADVFMHMHGG